MELFKKKKVASTTVMASAPNEPETSTEINYTKQLAEGPTTPVTQPIVQPTPEATPVQQESQPEEPKVIQVPVYMSQTGINELTIQNNQMLKELMAMASEEE